MIVTLEFKTHIVPKKNSFRAGITKAGRSYQYRESDAKISEAKLHYEAVQQMYKDKQAMTKKDVMVCALFKKTRADLTGVEETIFDAMQNAVYLNDRQIVSSHTAWSNRLSPGLTCVLVVSDEGFMPICLQKL